MSFTKTKKSSERDGLITFNKLIEEYTHTIRYNKNEIRRSKSIDLIDDNIFNEIMDKKNFESLYNYCIKNYNEENLLFYAEVLLFKTVDITKNQQYKFANRIFEKYIKQIDKSIYLDIDLNNSEEKYIINISGPIRENIIKQINENNININIFDDAIDEIRKVLSQNIIPEWNKLIKFSK